MSKPIIDFDTYIHLADNIASGVLEQFFPELLPADDEEWDPEGAHKDCAETEDEIRMLVREKIEGWCYVPNNPFASDNEPQLVSVQTGIANVCAELGSPLSQEEIDTLLTEKTGGMYDE